jgi:hypothetical protein
MKVATIFGKLIFLSFFFLPPLFKTQEGVVVGFQIFALANKNNKNSGEKNKIWTPTPWPPAGDFSFF